MRRGFKNILQNYRGTTVSEISRVGALRDYLEYLGTTEFRENIQKNFNLIGAVSVRLLNTVEKPCQLQRADKRCHQNRYSESTREYRPFRFEDPATNQTGYIYFEPSEQHRISALATGTYSSFDGSGYQLLFDHANPDLLARQNLLAGAALPQFFAASTKGAVVNFNLHYPINNVNVTTEIVLTRLTPALRNNAIRQRTRQPTEDSPLRPRLLTEPPRPLHNRHPSADL